MSEFSRKTFLSAAAGLVAYPYLPRTRTGTVAQPLAQVFPELGFLRVKHPSYFLVGDVFRIPSTNMVGTVLQRHDEGFIYRHMGDIDARPKVGDTASVIAARPPDGARTFFFPGDLPTSDVV